MQNRIDKELYSKITLEQKLLSLVKISEEVRSERVMPDCIDNIIE